MSTPQDNANTVHRYLEFVAKGQPDEIAALYADDATVEDPVGSEVHIGRQAIRGFYGNLENVQSRTEVKTLRALGHEVAFYWTLSIGGDEGGMTMDIISVMTFNDDGRIKSMKAYWTPENITQR
ncbi:snoaL-like domain protein [Mycolicibacterium hassiacum DSM 44199]|uniref:SnoaL-like domain protein n=1 Tax=Mycolicibacterium hassiacum (strain DSM 44199 / CIP 105218 / JCM 12690 / 3849) TaxID=1122247 RepID=K5BJ73_MYCHD|nr:nuclear transport factor 2 family protein [Mycolicibacterium hassiacum]6P3L_A Chain A, SnoaL-like domain protein [Mycolicibacterium hassiacum DSM 44199]6P3L_B Chain B, SnoaL-like domain protein [Mycolicibacterium hassiacum DSM 44199]EKF22614.1 snoaL-like domain protein [Mycolicibacterium hassiacum DSM 44199]MBX5488953.1 nuclear transport factor 2 family protein [Mycolicibacterium hassiacum]MDA4088790.1 steroid delta-isomerase [Mycolicibacterium hassiacum DSM 44199]VCT91521.1 Steroid Delta-